MSNRADEELAARFTNERPQFERAIRGYSRNEVDSWLACHHRPTVELMARSAQATRRVCDLEATVAELERRTADAPPLESLADAVLRNAVLVSRDVQRRLILEAEAERDEVANHAAQVVRAAEARAAEILAAAEGDREEVDEIVDEARRQVDLFLQEGKALAREHARTKWIHAARARHELSLQLRSLDEQREAILAELAESQGLVTALKERLRDHAGPPAGDPPERRPETDHSSTQ